MQVLPDVDRQLPAVEMHRDGRVAAAQDVRDRGAGRAGPGGERLPHAALEDPRLDRVRRELRPPAHVRAVGELRVVLDRRADGREVERLERASVGHADRRLRVADLDVLVAPACARRPRARPPRAAAHGPCRPCSASPSAMRGRSSPATVWIENSRASVQPRRCRYMIASRAPLPDSSASDPSGLKIRSRATNPGSSGAESSSTPSPPTPRWRSHSRRTRSGGERERQAGAPPR